MSEKQTKSIDYKKVTPFKQGLLILSLILLFDFITMLGGVGEDAFFKPTIYWINVIAFILVYSIFNTIISLVVEDQNEYWGQSIITFAGICIIGGFLAYLFSGLTIDEAGSFRWLYMVLTMGYIIFLALVRTIRRIVFLAQKEDKRLRGEEED